MPLFEGMVCWPGDPAFQMRAVSSLSEGAGSNVSWLSLSTHAGTHVDAPYHVFPDGARVDELDPSVFFGPARVLEVTTPGPALSKSIHMLPATTATYSSSIRNTGAAWQASR